MNLIRTFHPVGQGAFYTERHLSKEGREFTMVYDCGSTSLEKKRLKAKIESTFPKNHPIDVLFLSHFHAGHVNGIPYLKRHCRIKRVVMPDVNREDIQLLKVVNRLTGNVPEVEQMVDDPRRFFGRSTVIYRIKERPRTPRETVAEDIFFDTDKGRKVPEQSGTRFRLNAEVAWFFIPFHYKTTGGKRQFIQSLKKQGLALGDIATLEALATHRKVVHRAYQSAGGDLNVNTMILFSGIDKDDPVRCNHRYDRESPLPVLHSGCLYMGDMNLNEKEITDDIKQRLSPYFFYAGTIQIPHHGSLHHFDPSILEGPVHSTVISYGEQNTHGYPSARVVEAIAAKDIGVYHITESPPSMVIQTKFVPDDTATLFNRAFALLNSKELKNSHENFYRTLTTDKEAFRRRRFRCEADCREHYEQAILLFDKILTSTPEHVLSLVFRGLAKNALSDYRGAMADYSKAIERDAHCFYAYRHRGDAKIAVKAYRHALADYTKAVELAPDEAVAYTRRAHALSALREHQRALADCSKAIELAPDHAEAYAQRGHTKKALKKYRGAVTDYSKVIEIDPYFADIYFHRGLAKRALKYYRSAVADYSTALERTPENAQIYFYRGNAKRALKDYHGAITDYSKAIEREPDYPIAYNNRGLARYELKDNRGAEADYSQAIELNPKYFSSYYNRGNVRKALKEYDAALADYSETIALRPKYSNAYYKRGLVKRQIKDYRGAIVDFSKAIKLNPQHTNARNSRKVAKKKLTESGQGKTLLRALLNKKRNWEAYQKILDDNKIHVLYHFTDKANLKSIIKHGGLYSWEYCEEKNITVPMPGGSPLSKELDKRYDLQDYVRLSFIQEHPMMYAAIGEGRIQQPVVLEINPVVCLFRKTKFADMNAAKTEHLCGAKVEDLKRIKFSLFKRAFNRLSERDRKYYQAEVLVKTWIPLRFITNLNEFVKL